VESCKNRLAYEVNENKVSEQRKEYKSRYATIGVDLPDLIPSTKNSIFREVYFFHEINILGLKYLLR
jgi:hypothetical protein